MEQKIIIFCPECARKNMDKIVTLENQIKFSEEITWLNHEKKIVFSDLWKGIVLSVYLLLIPFVIGLIYPLSYSEYYSDRVAFIFRTFYLHIISFLLVGIFLIIGLYYIVQAIKKISSIQQKREKLIETTNEITDILNQFLSSERIEIIDDLIQGLRNRFDQNYLKQVPMSQMSMRELQVFVVKSLKKLGYKNIQINNHFDSFDIHLFAENEHGKNSISIVKGELVITMDDVHKIAIGKAYFDCDQCILVTASKMTEDAKKLADQYYIDVWNQEKIDENINNNVTDEWVRYLEHYYDYSDRDLDSYTKYELQRMKKIS
ncbi:restriction endonuclease [Rummeliibacillus pycnus]|uniref:restriction endonuclease n=1 Tax=Rummeliibacillus pycnus TaxID=101070 RepID=UPI003D27F194